ncbi:MAG: DNA primase [Candidatus Jorgensenbacteria bacterium]|nr:DNA primase [Candidatus Jorgensenbacteria bacterium]
MSRDVDRLKEKLDIVEVVRGYLSLQPAGKNLKALCPFHPEKTASFIVSPDRKSWHCFGCGAGGDAIAFVMRYENMEFPEALKFLADKVGITLQSLNPAHEREFGVLYTLHEEARAFYEAALAASTEAKEYLKSRGLTGETAHTFGLGFAPGGETLTLFLLQKGFSVDDIVRSGLALKTGGLHRDRFDHRIIFPLMNAVGRVVAFAGRILPSGDKGGDPSTGSGLAIAKYVNSPETPIFSKSKVLYGLHATKRDIATAREVVFVEGQMDLLMSYQAGVKNVVAVSGTALTAHHLERLRRIADSAVLSFDNDEAGFHALERAMDTFHAFDFHVKAMDLGAFKDPAEAAEKDPAKLLNAVKEAAPAFRRLFRHYFPGGSALQDTAVVKRVVRTLLTKVKKLPSAVEQMATMKELAAASGISEVALLGELEALPVDAKPIPIAEITPERVAEGRLEMVANRLGVVAFTDQKLLAIIAENKEWLPGHIRKAFEEPASESAHAFEMQASYLLSRIPKDALERECQELVKQLKIAVLKRRQESARRDVNLAGTRSDEGALHEAMKVFQTIAAELHTLSQ